MPNVASRPRSPRHEPRRAGGEAIASSGAARHDVSLAAFVGVAAAAHAATYLVVGLVAMVVFDYTTALRDPALAAWLRPTDDPWVMVGPALQPLRGALFGLVLYPLRARLRAADGWRVLLGLFVGLGILGAFAPAPGSLEGLIYARLTPGAQLGGMVEVVLQALLLSVALGAWLRGLGRPWLGRALVTVAAAAVALPLLGLLAGSLG